MFKFFLIRLNAVVTNLLIISYQPSEGFCAIFRRDFLNYMFFGQQKKFLNFSNGQVYCTSDNRGEKVLQKIKNFLLNFSQTYAQKFFLNSFPQRYAIFIQKVFRIGRAQFWEPFSKFGKNRKKTVENLKKLH